MKTYSKEEQRQVALEIQNNNIPYTTEFLKDYKVMRDQTRKLKK